jgi:nicotinate-nucleotide pyrophosphorylase (carboxylating)
LKELGLRESVVVEASGGITPETVSEYAATGIDVLSLGYLTHSSAWLDFSLELRVED